MFTRRRALVLASSLTLLLSTFAFAQNPAPDAHTIPSIDAGIGSCSADFTISDSTGAPIYNAKIKVHIAYGTWSLHKLDLEVRTNIDGKARFTGLPNRLKHGLMFYSSDADRSAETFDDPSKTCTTQFPVSLPNKPQ
jgi:hypothetical protein